MKNIYFVLSFIVCANLIQAQTTTRLPLIEGLTSNTCGPCATWNGFYGPIIESNQPNEQYAPGIAVVKYQMDWPSPGNDPSYNGDGNMRKGFYGTSGIPDWYIDGVSNNGTQTEINNAKNNPAPLKITASYTLTGNQIDVTVQIIALSNLGSGNRCYIALTNKSYNYSGGTNGENTFKHVVRKMLPNGTGVYLPALNANDTLYVNESYTYTVATGTPAQNSNDLWNSTFEVVCWVQKTASKAVQNATIAPEGLLAVPENDKDDFAFIVYPNPTTENINLVFDGDIENETEIVIYNQLGEQVYAKNLGNITGRQNIEVAIENLSAGIYYVQLSCGNKLATEKILKQ